MAGRREGTLFVDWHETRLPDQRHTNCMKPCPGICLARHMHHAPSVSLLALVSRMPKMQERSPGRCTGMRLWPEGSERERGSDASEGRKVSAGAMITHRFGWSM